MSESGNFFGFPLDITPIDESDTTPYERMALFASGDGVLMAMGYRHGRIEIFEMIEKTENPASEPK